MTIVIAPTIQLQKRIYATMTVEMSLSAHCMHSFVTKTLDILIIYISSTSDCHLIVEVIAGLYWYC